MGEKKIMEMELQKVYPNSKVTLLKQGYEYSLMFYSREIPEQYIYTYDYQKEQRWITPSEEDSAEHVSLEEWCISKEGYLKIDLRHSDGTELSAEEAERIHEIVRVENFDGEQWEADRIEAFLSREDIRNEIDRTVATVNRKKNEKSLVFTLLADTHYVINGNFEGTAATIEAVNRQIKPDGIIHLGDLADGMLSKERCRYYSSQVLDRIREWKLPFYFVIGNHDSNYFRENPDRLTKKEQYDYYLKNKAAGELKENQLWYYQDFPEAGLRFLLLHSFDAEEKVRYGFPLEEIEWVKEQLASLSDGYKVIIFSHDAPLARLDYWASEIRNGDLLMNVLEEWQEQHDYRIMAYIHGHTHADFIYRERKFPIISIGASKCEFFPDKKPEGSVRYRREMGTVLQELWDTMIVHPDSGEIDFVRFGAGADRYVECSKTEVRQAGTYGPGDKQLEGREEDYKGCKGRQPRPYGQSYHTKIWAHRGASGYAPENTLEAFRLARDMGADGVELDVQFTKDRQLVVIHDETIDRVSDGAGYVVDHTLEELKSLRFNRTHPEYENAAIPTLREVLELMKSAGMMVNIELKTGVNFYDGIEKQVIKLVEELGMQEQVIYSSFNHESVMRVKRLCPNAKTGLLYSCGIYDAPGYAASLGVCALHPSLANMQYPQFMEQCKDKGIKVHVWTVNDREDMRRMAEEGVDAVITNYPDVVREILYGEKRTAERYGEEDGRRERSEKAGNRKRKSGNILLHGCGLAYARVRRVFVKIDQMVQRAAGR